VVDFSNISQEELLKRKVDFLEKEAIRYPFLRESIDSTIQLVYGA